MIFIQIDDYAVRYYSNRSQNSPIISLSMDLHIANAPYPVLRPIGELIFKPNGSILPPDEVVPVLHFFVARMYFYLEDFQNVIDLLRNEKPLYLTTPSGPGVTGPFCINTSNEPIGEAEK